MVLALTFRLLIHIEVIFVHGMRLESKFILLHVAFKLSHHHLLKLFLAVNSDLNQLAIYFYLWALDPIHHMSILMRVSHSFDHYSFVVSIEIRKCELTFLFQDWFGSLKHLIIPYKFEGWLFNFCQKAIGILIGLH